MLIRLYLQLFLRRHSYTGWIFQLGVELNKNKHDFKEEKVNLSFEYSHRLEDWSVFFQLYVFLKFAVYVYFPELLKGVFNIFRYSS